MRENRTSGSMRGRRKRAASRRACALLYEAPGRVQGLTYCHRFTRFTHEFLRRTHIISPIHDLPQCCAEG
jgi:hypothetical protein